MRNNRPQMELPMLEDSLSKLNDRQREAVTTTEGPILVIAGAGSGKTRVLTERIAYLLRAKRVPPQEILAFTFTNKAAREMKERLERSVPGLAHMLWVGTFHATGVRILRRHGEAVGVKRNFTIYDSDDSLGIVKGILSRNVMDTRVARSPRSLRDRFSRWKNDLITPSLAAEQANNVIEQRVALMYAEYEKELRRANALDFDDLIARVVELFAVNEEIKELYARRFRYILVDEFQDTNAIQMAMIDGLQSVHGNLFVVGDDDQSIYSWRGARVEHILEFEHHYPDTKLVRLEQNYRSTRTVLDAANGVIAHNIGRKGKNLWTDGDTGDKLKVMVSMDEAGESINVLHVIKEAIERGFSPRDIAVLYRTNAQSRALEEAFIEGTVQYQIIGSVRFYERMEVRDILAYCKVLVNPDDSVNLKRIINVPRRGIGKTSFERLETLALERGTSIIDLLRGGEHPLTGAARKRVEEFMVTFEKLVEAAETKVAPHVVETIIEEIGYYDHLQAGYPDSENRIENVEELISKAHNYAEGAEDPSLRAFLEEVALVADVDALDLEAGQITLMTLHNAKGLEFDCIIITGLEEGLLPHFNSIDDDSAVEEERRLFYVGMTRAKKELYLSFANMRRRMGHIEGGMPSRFLFEIPEGCLEEPIEQPSLGVRGGSGGYAQRSEWAGGHQSDAFAAQTQPDYEDFSQEERAFEVGTRIVHDNFGRGVVRKIEGHGEQLRVTVIFDSGSERKFLAHFAPMRPI
jgi:DNA helicase-2/ATP-dependent DNA helicase PcrA